MTAAISLESTKIMQITNIPIKIPAGSTFTASSSFTNSDAPIEPMAIPTANIAISLVASCSLMPNLSPAQRNTTNCNVAPAPQNKVVTASETWPCGSRHSVVNACQKSRSK